jgi:hypothetical protein
VPADSDCPGVLRGTSGVLGAELPRDVDRADAPEARELSMFYLEVETFPDNSPPRTQFRATALPDGTGSLLYRLVVG